MNLIVAVDKNWAIGYQNKLLCSLPSDMAFFRKTTLDHTVVMGRKTLESFPGSKPLKKRSNIVLSNTLQNPEDLIVIRNIDDLKPHILEVGTNNIFIIGGQSIYELFLAYCRNAYITKLDQAYPADSYFPNLDQMKNWKPDSIIQEIYEKHTHATIIEYINTDVKLL